MTLAPFAVLATAAISSPRGKSPAMDSTTERKPARALRDGCPEGGDARDDHDDEPGQRRAQLDDALCGRRPARASSRPAAAPPGTPMAASLSACRPDALLLLATPAAVVAVLIDIITLGM
jgi:hypothetical protein